MPEGRGVPTLTAPRRTQSRGWGKGGGQGTPDPGAEPAGVAEWPPRKGSEGGGQPTDCLVSLGEGRTAQLTPSAEGPGSRSGPGSRDEEAAERPPRIRGPKTPTEGDPGAREPRSTAAPPEGHSEGKAAGILK